MLKKVHRPIKLSKSCVKPYIHTNTQLKEKQKLILRKT